VVVRRHLSLRFGLRPGPFAFPAGPFTVTVVNVDHTLTSYHIIRLNLQLPETWAAPHISLAYHGRTSKAVDNLGNAYNTRTTAPRIPHFRSK